MKTLQLLSAGPRRQASARASAESDEACQRKTKDKADGMREKSAHCPRRDSNLYLWNTRPPCCRLHHEGRARLARACVCVCVCVCHRGHYEGLSRCRLVGSCVLPGENSLHRPTCKTTFARLTQSQAISQSFRVFITFRSMRDTTIFHCSKLIFIQNYRFLYHGDQKIS